MRARFTYFAVLVIATTAASCSNHENSDVSLDVSVSNATTTSYWVDMDWQAVPVGILPPGISKTGLDVSPPNSNIVTLDLEADTNRQHQTTIKTDISALRQLSPGHHDVTISIVSENQAKLLIDGHEK
jgi:hypothetical protein